MVDMRLKGRDFVITLDKSGSMSSNVKSGYTRWQQGQEYVTAMARYVTKNDLDPDGIKVVVFSGRANVYDNVTEEKVQEVFETEEPMGSTNLTNALEISFQDYLARKAAGETNGGELNIVLTDGEPNDRKSVMASIAKFTKQLDSDDEYGISFIQVGNDAGATEYLQALDDKLEGAGAKFDIVDTKTCDQIDELGLSIEEILVAALDD